EGRRPGGTSRHELVNPFVLFRQGNCTGGLLRCDMLKMDHNTGNVLPGDDKTVIEAGERFTVNPNEMIDTCSIPWDRAGKKRKDPWSRAVYLPMKDSDGEVVAFKATGAGAIAEIGELVGMYGSADRHGKLPVVEIDSRSFESQHGSTIHEPV